ncbi:ABC transporter permease subunit [Clostridium sp. KNHs205]|uniref:ABC transporter permease n=1 Tax=Clostridium sp. KNHs205 TaxID=1449050 RepID=UPI00051B57E0|nr:ABC transporter permease subunit [Clostridium sp. KNHs205]
MISYIKSEYFRIFRNKWTYLFILLCSGLLVSSNVVLTMVKASEKNFPYATTKFALSMFYSNFPIVFILCIAITAMVFGNEHTNHTMKNSVSYGISRGDIFFGKLIVEVVYSILAFVIIGALDIGFAYLLLDNSGVDYMLLLLKACAAAFPLFLVAIAITNSFLFTIESTGASNAASVGLLLAFPLVCNMLGMKFTFFMELAKLLPWNMIYYLGFDMEKFQPILLWGGRNGYGYYWLIACVEIIIVSVIGFVLFKKKEIK